MVSVGCFLTVATIKGEELHQLDGNNAFLHANLDEEAYMTMPLGFRSSNHINACRLHKSPEGLKLGPL